MITAKPSSLRMLIFGICSFLYRFSRITRTRRICLGKRSVRKIPESGSEVSRDWDSALIPSIYIPPRPRENHTCPVNYSPNRQRPGRADFVEEKWHNYDNWSRALGLCQPPAWGRIPPTNVSRALPSRSRLIRVNPPCAINLFLPAPAGRSSASLGTAGTHDVEYPSGRPTLLRGAD